ncbi:MAG: transketolase [Candidatus Aureabacteria bacterium]|nr:transketolase [Candidatus Auribacterota bacterium]
MVKYEEKSLKRKAAELRIEIVDMITRAGSGHPGGSLSAIDLLTVLYYSIIKVDPQKPDWNERDRFVLSKGHAAPAIYAILADLGFFPKEKLTGLRQFGSILQGHPDMRKVPGIDISTGSLGQGLSVAVGMALAGKIDKKKYKVFALLGDGEIQEGQIWEASMAAAHYNLDNLCMAVDHNGLQIDGKIEDVMNPSPIEDKFISFGWKVKSIDGHSLKEIYDAWNWARSTENGKPSAIIAKTVKGKGVSFMENVVGFHGKAPTKEQGREALDSLKKALNGVK